jgi:hypothetical protein
LADTLLGCGETSPRSGTVSRPGDTFLPPPLTSRRRVLLEPRPGYLAGVIGTDEESGPVVYEVTVAVARVGMTRG